MKKLLVLMLALVLAMSCFTFASAEEKIVITQWCFALTGEDDSALFDPIMAAFEAENPGVDIQIEYVPWQNRFEKINSAVAAGTMADICYLNEDNFAAYADAGKMVALEQYPECAELIEDFTAGAKKSLSWNGSVYVMPVLQTISYFAYNKVLAAEAGLDPETPPTNWEEFMTWATAMTKDTDGDGEIDQWGLSQPLAVDGIYRNYDKWLWQNGGEMFNEDYTKVAFNTPEAIEALEYMAGMYGTIVNPNDVAANVEDSKAAFLDGRAAMVELESGGMTYTILNAIENGEADPEKIQVGFAPVFENKARFAYGTMAGYGIFSTCEHPEVAAKWLAFLTNDENTLTIDKAIGFLPPRVSLQAKMAESAETEFDKFCLEQAAYCHGSPSIPNYTTMSAAVLSNIQRACMGEISAQEALETSAVEVQKIIDSNS